MSVRERVRRQVFWRRRLRRGFEPPPPEETPPPARRSVGERLRTHPEATLKRIRELVAAEPADVGPRRWFQMLVAVFGYGDHELARELFAVFERRADEWREGPMRRDWIRPWIEAEAGSPLAPRPVAGRHAFAIVDYGHPGINRGSANLGDHMQTIAALGHLVRHENVRLHGPDELVELLVELRSRTRPERRRSEIDADVEVMTVHRDASEYQRIPDGTWVLCFGWYMHALFGMRHGFPLHRGLRPIFISFHCNKRELLTPDAIEYLQRYGPVGCRDWTTVDLLLSVGVPAFFSGCVTTTIDTVFPAADRRPPRSAPVGYVDIADAPPDAVTYRHSDRAVRRTPFVANVRRALALLETYRTRHRRIVTSRLHCYLPARALGIDVEFRPENRSDVRFAGLADLDERGFHAMREGLLTKLERVFGAILSDRPEAEVYEIWRALTAADVAAARERHERPLRLPEPPRAIAERARAAGAHTAHHDGGRIGPVTHCAVAPANGDEPSDAGIATVVESLLEHVRGALHVWVLDPHDDGTRERRLAERFPLVAFSVVPIRRVPSAELLLAELLPSVDRVVVVRAGATVAPGVVETELGEHAVAARTLPGESGFRVIHRAASRLGDRADLAEELRRSAYARHRFDFDAFADDVLVLDLARLRADGFRDLALGLVERFRLRDREILHYVVGPDRAQLPVP